MPAVAPALRRMQVVFAPHLPRSECHYIVERTGVRGLHPAELAGAQAQQQQEWQQAQQQQGQGQGQGQGQQQEQQQQGQPSCLPAGASAPAQEAPGEAEHARLPLEALPAAAAAAAERTSGARPGSRSPPAARQVAAVECV
jgi:hypothetical protein